jgi:hypothetical protein
MASRIFPENKTCIAILEWMDMQYPVQRKHIIKIENEGKRGYLMISIYKSLGFNSKASDYFLAYPNKTYSGLWIEVKRDGWKFTKSQKEHIDGQLEFIDNMKSVGYYGAMVVGVDQGIKLIDDYLKDRL